MASFFIIIWGIFINHFGFTLQDTALAVATYFIGLFTVNILILTLIIIYFKKLRFMDIRQSTRFRLLVENSSDSMFLYDYKRQEFEYVSPTIANLIGVTDKQLYKMPERFFDYVNTVEKNKEIIGIFSRPVTEPGNGILCLYKNGIIEKWSEIHYIPIRDNTGMVSAIEGILRHITERKQMEEDLKEAEQTKKEFLENISHEIKTPVTLNQGEFHIAQSGHRAVVSAEIAENAILIVDPYRIQQVVSNLINNSIRHTPMRQEISISCRTCLKEELLPLIPDWVCLFPCR